MSQRSLIVSLLTLAFVPFVQACRSCGLPGNYSPIHPVAGPKLFIVPHKLDGFANSAPPIDHAVGSSGIKNGHLLPPEQPPAIAAFLQAKNGLVQPPEQPAAIAAFLKATLNGDPVLSQTTKSNEKPEDFDLAAIVNEATTTVKETANTVDVENATNTDDQDETIDEPGRAVVGLVAGAAAAPALIFSGFYLKRKVSEREEGDSFQRSTSRRFGGGGRDDPDDVSEEDTYSDFDGFESKFEIGTDSALWGNGADLSAF